MLARQKLHEVETVWNACLGAIFNVTTPEPVKPLQKIKTIAAASLH